MAISLGSNLALHTRLPLDDRTIMETIEEMKDYPENFLPDIAYCFVKSDGKMYVFNRSNTDDHVLGKWRVFDGGSGEAKLEEDITANIECGAIKVDDILPSGMTLTEYVKKQVVAELAPVVKITSPISESKENGEITTSVHVVADIIKKTFPISKIEFLCNGSKINEITSQATSGEVSFDYTVSTNDTTLEFEIKATDTASKSSSDTVVIKYGNAVFYGADTSADFCNTSDKVRALANKKLGMEYGGLITITVDAGSQTFAIAIPSTMNVTSVKFIESLNLQMIDDMTKIENVMVEGANGYSAISYRVYQYVSAIPFSQTSHFEIQIG